MQSCWDKLSVWVSVWPGHVFCVSGDMDPGLFLPVSPVRPPLCPLPCLFSVKSLRRRAVTVCAQETGQGGTAGSQSLVSSCAREGRGEGAGREETVRTWSTGRPSPSRAISGCWTCGAGCGLAWAAQSCVSAILTNHGARTIREIPDNSAPVSREPPLLVANQLRSGTRGHQAVCGVTSGLRRPWSGCQCPSSVGHRSCDFFVESKVGSDLSSLWHLVNFSKT